MVRAYLPPRVKLRQSLPMTFWAYILRCADGSYYTGHTDDLEHRTAQHQAGTCGGQHIDVSLLDGQLAAASHVSMGYLATGVQPARIGAASHFMVPYQPFDCADGQLVVLCGNDGQFRRLAAALGHVEWADDPRYTTNFARLAHRDSLVAAMRAVLVQRSRADWQAALQAAGIPCAPIQDFAEAFADPQVRHRGMVFEQPFAATGTLRQIANPLRFSETPVRYDRPPPALGEHTDEVCAQLLNIPVEKLRALRAAGVI